MAALAGSTTSRRGRALLLDRKRTLNQTEPKTNQTIDFSVLTPKRTEKPIGTELPATTEGSRALPCLQSPPHFPLAAQPNNHSPQATQHSHPHAKAKPYPILRSVTVAMAARETSGERRSEQEQEAVPPTESPMFGVGN
jgi:hypothetical protein